MIEAVNSVISNAPFLKSLASQVSVEGGNNQAPAYEAASAPDSPLAPYLSLVVEVDYDYDKAVLQVRDTNTGDVLDQFPSEEALRARRAYQHAQEQAALLGGSSHSNATSSSSSGASGSSSGGFTPLAGSADISLNLPDLSSSSSSPAPSAAPTNTTSSASGPSPSTTTSAGGVNVFA